MRRWGFFALVLAYTIFAQRGQARATYKIGYSSFPPYFIVQSDGSPTGFSVEVLKEAARRSGIRLAWTRYQSSPDVALSKGDIDIFPMLAILPERAHLVDYSSPWWENSLVLVSLRSRPVRTAEDTVGKKISLIHASFGLQRMMKLFPKALPQPSTDYRVVVASVCQGDSDAAIMETRLANSLQFLNECRNQDLTMAWFPELNLTYGVGVRKGLKFLADRLHEEIVGMALDGTMTRLGEPWGVVVTNQRKLTQQLEAARARDQWWKGGILASLVIVFVLAYATVRMRKAKEMAQRAANFRAKFLANVSHEIRTPLHGLIGMTELLASTPLSPEQRDYVEAIEGAGKLLLSQINDLLDYSKLEAGKMELESIPFSPRILIQEVKRLYEATASKKGLTLLASSEVSEYVLGDPTRLRQVLNNLLSNAIKFTEQGEVQLTCLRIQGRSRAWLRFSVKDTGIGIEPAVRERIFQAFTQADGSTTRRYGGTGLGLAICRELVALMGGEIGVESQLGQGSEFWFTIPLVPARKETAGSCQNDEAESKQETAVLVADDHPVNQRLLAAQLKQLGCTAVIARNGAQAVELVRKQRFDLVLMDGSMPELDGFDATRQIRSLSSAVRDVPIIGVTASGYPEDIRKALAAGMNDVLQKPFDLSQLREVVTRWTTSKT
ncbi:MAG: ATP-binding protein [Bryobacteraceae bacterium]|nr:ATP-binding protein [Bryobacteraceae bacterium]MDW8378909.1 ATP-binding protein [Bryobacterales bacterium]